MFIKIRFMSSSISHVVKITYANFCNFFYNTQANIKKIYKNKTVTCYEYKWSYRGLPEHANCEFKF